MRTLRIAVVLVLLGVAWQCHSYAQGHGFQLRGLLTFGGFHAGEPVWVVGKGMRIIAVDPVLHKHLLELEAQQVTVTIKANQ